MSIAASSTRARVKALAETYLPDSTRRQYKHSTRAYATHFASTHFLRKTGVGEDNFEAGILKLIGRWMEWRLCACT